MNMLKQKDLKTGMILKKIIKFSSNFVNGTQSRYTYSITPVKTTEEETENWQEEDNTCTNPIG